MKKPHSKVGLILVSLYLFVFIIFLFVYKDCGGLLCGVEMLFLCYPWCWYEFFTFLPNSIVPIFEIYGGILINCFILYFSAYSLENIFKKEKIYQSKMFFFWSIFSAIGVISIPIGYIVFCKLNFKNCNYFIISLEIIIVLVLLALIFKKRNITHWIVLLNIILFFIYINLYPITGNKIPKDIRDCNEISDTYSRDYCYTNLVKSNNDIKICENINNIVRKNACYKVYYTNLAKANNNIEICENIYPEDDKNECFYEILQINPSITTEKYLNLCNKFRFDSVKAECLRDLASQKKDQSICDSITWSVMKKSCIRRTNIK